MRSPRPQNRVFYALCANAAVLVLILCALISRGGGSQLGPSAAFAQQQPPIAGGGGVFVMPAQLSPNVWGCFLMDIDNQTLCVYQYSPGEKMLRLSASRTFKFDRGLNNFNTSPPPLEVRDLVQREREALRVTEPATPKSPEVQKEQ
jgi:hypothetical protein